MSNRLRNVIVDEGRCVFCSIPTKKVHHHDFPEIWAEAGSVEDAISHLTSQLALYREGAQSIFHRELIDLALADVAEYAERVVNAGPGQDLCCRCKPGPIANVRRDASVPMKVSQSGPQSP